MTNSPQLKAAALSLSKEKEETEKQQALSDAIWEELNKLGLKDGPQGVQGRTGEAGKDGVAGSQGVAGEDGSQGATGAAGKDGNNGADGVIKIIREEIIKDTTGFISLEEFEEWERKINAILQRSFGSGIQDVPGAGTYVRIGGQWILLKQHTNTIVSYQSLTVNHEIITCNNVADIIITLDPEPLDLQEVTVIRKNGPVTLSAPINGDTSCQIAAKFNAPHLVFLSSEAEWSFI